MQTNHSTDRRPNVRADRCEVKALEKFFRREKCDDRQDNDEDAVREHREEHIEISLVVDARLLNGMIW